MCRRVQEGLRGLVTGGTNLQANQVSRVTTSWPRNGGKVFGTLRRSREKEQRQGKGPWDAAGALARALSDYLLLRAWYLPQTLAQWQQRRENRGGLVDAEAAGMAN